MVIFMVKCVYCGIVPTERTQHESAVINDTNDGLPCKYGGEFCLGSFILGGADSMNMLSRLVSVPGKGKCLRQGSG